jgi:hypothetical protein
MELPSETERDFGTQSFIGSFGIGTPLVGELDFDAMKA